MGEQERRLYDAAGPLEIEGIMAKKADAPYTCGRSKNWVKVRTPAGRLAQERRSEQWDER